MSIPYSSSRLTKINRCAGILVATVLATSAFAEDRSYQFDIPQKPLSQALRDYGQISGQEIIFTEDLVAGLNTTPLRGKFTADLALERLLQGTGLIVQRSPSGARMIRRANPEGTAQPTPKTTSLTLSDVAAINLAQLDSADETTSKTKSQQKSASDVEEMIVKEKMIKPFSDSNVDVPRTINDEQPYYIFDAQTIERSGATTVEDFLKTRLTMNTVGLTNSQDPVSFYGNTSSINLRGLGADKTLILVNGRRIPGIVYQTSDNQPDINGIPLSAIDRIEVLPSSASGIYGGSAIGGVINVVLKRDYSGGEVRLAYDNTWDTDAPARRASATFGHSLEGGKTNLMITGQWSSAEPLLFGDRRELLDRGLNIVMRNSPGSFYSTGTPFLGSAPNITTTAYRDPVTGVLTPDPGVLTLKDGRSLGSRNTYVPVGTVPGISLATLSDRVLANAGSWNLDLPPSTQSPTGLYRPLSSTPTNHSVVATVRRHMTANVEAFAEFNYQSNHTETTANTTVGSLTIPASSPTNPFNSAVVVRFPDAADVARPTASVTRTFTAGANLRLPLEWTAQVDYSFAKNAYGYSYYSTMDSTAINAAAVNGTLNPFVDTLLYPLAFDGYRAPTWYLGSSTLGTFALRGSGPLMHLPWGAPTLTAGVEHRSSKKPEGKRYAYYPVATNSSNIQTYLAREQTTDSVYAEAHIPLVARGTLPLVHALDAQVSGRSERYIVDAGTSSYSQNVNTGVITYGTPRLPDGRPFMAQTSYTSNNYTFGFKYQPVPTVTVRASMATAFLPPTPSQLIPDTSGGYMTQIIDPQTGQTLSDVRVFGSGNPELKPQNSSSRNIGVIFEPARLSGLRFNAEYYKIAQADQISSLSPQDIVNSQNVYSDRVVRNSIGRIVGVDTSLLNLYKLESEGWDVSIDYRLKTRLGVFNIRTAQTYIMHEKRQLLLILPLYDYAGYVGEGGPAKHKGNLGFGWEYRDWNAGWTAYYFGSYKQAGAAGGPWSLQSTVNTGQVQGTTVALQGSQSIGAQVYHDFFASYSFGKRTLGNASGMAGMGAQLLNSVTVQLGIKNVFNTIPPYDANYGGTYYISPYGDKRLRSYWLNVSKTF